jgi:2',3'-cyclic-nucleotide 2'-phosphodiesterase (5'-nucleotidase family)
VDAGDFGQPDNPRVPGGWEVTEYAARTLGEIGCDAWTPGERELLHGPDKLKQLVAAFKTSVVSANIRIDGKRLFDDRVVKKSGGVTVGITGVTGPEVLLDGKGISEEGAKRAAAFELTEPARALKPIVADLSKKCDVVVVLAHLAPPEARRLAEEVPGIDVMVVGHVPGSGYDGDRVGDTWFLRTGQRGQMVSFLRMTVAGGAVTEAKGIYEELGPTLPHDADLHTRTALFDQEIKAMREKVGPRAPTR